LRRYRYACARCVVRLHVVRRARFVRFVRSVRSVYGGANELEGVFSVSEAQTTLTQAAKTATACSSATAATRGRATAAFSTAGCVTSVSLVVLDPLTPADAECVINAFLAARVSPYARGPVTVSKVFGAPQ
jgi:hypothetical protein